MRVVSTAVKNHPSKRASFDWTARTQASKSVCTCSASPVVRGLVWRKSDMVVGALGLRGRGYREDCGGRPGGGGHPPVLVADVAGGLVEKVLVVGVAVDPARDERADRGHAQALGTGPVQRGTGQRRADTAALVGVVDLGVYEGDKLRGAQVGGVAGQAVADAGLVAVVLDGV